MSILRDLIKREIRPHPPTMSRATALDDEVGIQDAIITKLDLADGLYSICQLF